MCNCKPLNLNSQWDCEFSEAKFGNACGAPVMPLSGGLLENFVDDNCTGLSAFVRGLWQCIEADIVKGLKKQMKDFCSCPKPRKNCQTRESQGSMVAGGRVPSPGLTLAQCKGCSERPQQMSLIPLQIHLNLTSAIGLSGLH